ncbi:hypothetical protein [Carnobacterium alterfunditum]|uniref:hypothetical protein n=1 Tax=Carnobacterium alterfunditum TaxID=28230 RepID=UPI0035932B8B
MIKKRAITIALLTVLTTVSSVMGNYNTVKAAPLTGQTITQSVPQNADETVPSELIGLDKYITRNSNGTLTLDKSTALKNGYQNETVTWESTYLDSLNTLIKSGELVTDNNLNIENKATTNSNSNIITAAVADKGVTVTKHFWWGVNRYLSNFESIKVASTLNALAIGGTTASGVCIAIGTGPIGASAAVITIGYIALLANRIDGYNSGSGVCIHMTKAMVYTVRSQ